MNRAQEYAEQQVRALGVNPNYSMHERMKSEYSPPTSLKGSPTAN